MPITRQYLIFLSRRESIAVSNTLKQSITEYIANKSYDKEDINELIQNFNYDFIKRRK